MLPPPEFWPTAAPPFEPPRFAASRGPKSLGREELGAACRWSALKSRRSPLLEGAELDEVLTEGVGSEPAIRSGFTSVKTGRDGAALGCPALCEAALAVPPFFVAVGAAGAGRDGAGPATRAASPVPSFGALVDFVVVFGATLAAAVEASGAEVVALIFAVVFAVDFALVFAVDFAADLAAGFVVAFAVVLVVVFVAALGAAVFFTVFGSAFAAVFAAVFETVFAVVFVAFFPTSFAAVFLSPTAADDFAPAFFAAVVAVFFEDSFDGVFVGSFSDRSFAAIG